MEYLYLKKQIANIYGKSVKHKQRCELKSNLFRIIDSVIYKKNSYATEVARVLRVVYIIK